MEKYKNMNEIINKIDSLELKVMSIEQEQKFNG